MKAYKDLEKTQECEDEDRVAVAVFGGGLELTQPDPALQPVFRDGILDAGEIGD